MNDGNQDNPSWQTALEHHEELCAERARTIGERFNSVDVRFNSVDVRFNSVDARFSSPRKKTGQYRKDSSASPLAPSSPGRRC